MKKFLILFVIIVFIEIAIIITSLFNKISSPQENSLVNPTPTINVVPNQVTSTINSEAPANDNFSRTPQEIQQDNQMSFVSDLIGKLPYYGNSFMLNYNFDTAVFVLTLDASRAAEANNEFDVYLKSNKISDRSLFENLVTAYR